ncbi:MAG: hypothetical protein HC925_00850 [Coleofasciculaceae cyanobacterium SM2_3_26]|nr:hypothetical protein [Coleofasciculaceae cyanobacterium SM2_3_26]
MELGSIYQLQGEAQRAKKMFLTAQQLLQKLPPEASVDGITYQSLLAEVEQILARSDRTASE